MNRKIFDALVIGDIHESEHRTRALYEAKESILDSIKDKQFKKIILLGDLFDKKPTTKERISLAQFILKLRQHTTEINFLVGNGRHTFEAGEIYEQDWINLCPDFKQYTELEINNYVLGHYEVKGTKYINGFESKSERVVDPNKTYILGHIHSPKCSFKNVNYVGSVYKTAFDQINDQKRIALLHSTGIEWLNIVSRPMYEIHLVGRNGMVKGSGLRELQQANITDIDLKITVNTDSASLSNIHQTIKKIQDKFHIEYYQQQIEIKEIKVDIPESLDQEVLLKKYCSLKNVDFKLVQKEL